MKRWNVLGKLKKQSAGFRIDKLIKLLLENRGFINKEEIEKFLNPKLENITIDGVGIDKKQLKKTLDRINSAIEKKEQIVVFGDYDVDGITGTAILWETLHAIGANVMPYIPDRIEEGYGLSVQGIQNSEFKIRNIKLIITVDNGIVANEAVDFANKQSIDVIITDHHTVGKNLPDAYSIVHTTKLCGAGVALLLSQQLKETVIANLSLPKVKQSLENGIAASPAERGSRNDKFDDNHLELACLGTVADLVPLTGENKTIVKYGLQKLGQTTRPGLLELFKQAGIESAHPPAGRAGARNIGVYEVGFIIAPRLNAAGRIDSAMDSLRLLCTKNSGRAKMLAEKLEQTNRERQQLMKEAADHAISNIKDQISKPNSKLKSILIIENIDYKEGVIGLVAGKVVEHFYRPAIVIAKRDKQSKASARSVSGFNIIEFLRSRQDFFVNVGGHPMAAGFTIETERIIEFKKALEDAAEKLLDEATLTRSLKIDCELPLEVVNTDLYDAIQRLGPFGMGNSEPVFATRGVVVESMKVLGREKKHLKFEFRIQNSPQGHYLLRRVADFRIEGIAFNMGGLADEIKVGDRIDVAYVIDENRWNGSTKLQLKVKDISILYK